MPAARSPPAPMKKKPAIGSTDPIALKANTKPSVIWSAQTSRLSARAFGGERCQDHQRRAHAADQRGRVAALEFRQAAGYAQFGQHHHRDHGREAERA